MNDAICINKSFTSWKLLFSAPSFMLKHLVNIYDECHTLRSLFVCFVLFSFSYLFRQATYTSPPRMGQGWHICLILFLKNAPGS